MKHRPLNVKMPRVVTTGVVLCAALVMGAARANALGAQAGEDIQLVTVVGCLQQQSGELPWLVDHATEGTTTETAFTSEEEVERSRGQALGSLEYRLLGVGEFSVEAHVGHKVQVKGLALRHNGERRLNITSFQHLSPTCP